MTGPHPPRPSPTPFPPASFPSLRLVRFVLNPSTERMLPAIAFARGGAYNSLDFTTCTSFVNLILASRKEFAIRRSTDHDSERPLAQFLSRDVFGLRHGTTHLHSLMPNPKCCNHCRDFRDVQNYKGCPANFLDSPDSFRKTLSDKPGRTCIGACLDCTSSNTCAWSHCYGRTIPR